MRRRNGVGSQQLQDVTEKFRKGELKLLRTMEEEGLISEKERTGLAEKIDRSVSQKRSSEVLSTAHTIHNRLIRALQAGKEEANGRMPVELDVLAELSRLIQTSGDREKVLERILDLIAQGVPYENGTLFILSRATGRLVPAVVRGRHVDLITSVQFDHGYGFSSWVAKEKKPILLNELHAGSRTGGDEIGSFLSVPMVIQGELIGVLNLAHTANGAFQEEHLRLLTLIASQAAALLQRVVMFEELARLAITDDLTALFNRRHFLERLNDEIRRGERYGVHFSLLFLDIDNFKVINDSYGHTLGDRILTDLGKVLRKWGRSSDLIARYGGEEFVAILPMTDARQAEKAADRLRSMVAERSFPRRKRLTVSLGVASYPADGRTAEELLQRADGALYQAKKQGRNRTVLSGAQAEAAKA